MGTVWANIATKSEDGKLKILAPGTSVSEGDFAEGDYEEFVREGVIRDMDFPDYVQPGESVRTAIIRKAKEDYENAIAPSLGVNLDTMLNLSAQVEGNTELTDEQKEVEATASAGNSPETGDKQSSDINSQLTGS